MNTSTTSLSVLRTTLLKVITPGIVALLLAVLSMTLAPDNTWAASADPAEAPSNITASGEVYVQLGPSFVTNYDGAGRLKYLKADVNVRIHQQAEDTLREHMPYLRNQLVVLFSQQLEEDLTSIAGKELLREQALQTVKKGLAHLDSQELADQVSDLFFTAFVVQR